MIPVRSLDLLHFGDCRTLATLPWDNKTSNALLILQPHVVRCVGWMVTGIGSSGSIGKGSGVASVAAMTFPQIHWCIDAKVRVSRFNAAHFWRYRTLPKLLGANWPGMRVAACSCWS